MKKNTIHKEMKPADLLADVALKFGKVAANSSCACIFHQPKTPDALKDLRKF